MTSLLIRAAIILAAAEIGVMFLLPPLGLLGHPLIALLDPLLMLAFALGPLYLLLKRERTRLKKRRTWTGSCT